RSSRCWWSRRSRDVILAVVCGPWPVALCNEPQTTDNRTQVLGWQHPRNMPPTTAWYTVLYSFVQTPTSYFNSVGVDTPGVSRPWPLVRRRSYVQQKECIHGRDQHTYRVFHPDHPAATRRGAGGRVRGRRRPARADRGVRDHRRGRRHL